MFTQPKTNATVIKNREGRRHHGNQGNSARTNSLYVRIKKAVLAEQESESKKDFVSNSSGFGIPGVGHVTDCRQNIFKRILWGVIVTACLSICIYQISDRVRSYLEYPLGDDIQSIRNTTVKFPQITLCSVETVELVKLRQEFVNENEGFDACSVKLVDLIGFRGLTAVEIWQTTRILNEGSIKFQVAPGLSEFVSLEFTEKMTLNGLCRIIRIPTPVVYAGVESQLQVTRDKIPDACDENAYWMSAEMDHDVSDYKSVWRVPAESDVGFALNVKQFKSQETPSNPCVDSTAQSQCFQECIDAKIESKVTCKLPFMTRSTKPDCANIQDAKVTFGIAVEVHVESTLDDCKCDKKCTGNIYTMNRETFELDQNYTKLAFYFGTNDFEIVISSQSYTFISLLCDVGGNLGLYLGLSVLSIFEIFQSIISRKQNVVNISK